MKKQGLLTVAPNAETRTGIDKAENLNILLRVFLFD